MATVKNRNSVSRIPVHPNGTFGTSFPYLNNGLYLYSWNSKMTISDYFGFSYEIAGNALVPVSKWLNGYCYFYSSNLGKYLWYSTTWTSWVFTATLPGIPPVEVWVWDDETETTGEYAGDIWHSGTPPAFEASSSFLARGSLRGTTLGAYEGTPITVETTWEYWQRESETAGTVAGLYEYQGILEEPNYIVGLPLYKDENNVEYLRSLEQVGGKYTYGTISYNTTADKWIIGIYNRSSGWWESTIEPNKDDATIFYFTKPEGSEAEDQPDKTITFDSYTIGDNTSTSYFFNVGKWHKT